MIWKGVILNEVGNLKKKIWMVAKTSANIVPFIKALKPNMKRMHSVHIWPADIHIHDTQKNHGGLF